MSFLSGIFGADLTQYDVVVPLDVGGGIADSSQAFAFVGTGNEGKVITLGKETLEQYGGHNKMSMSEFANAKGVLDNVDRSITSMTSRDDLVETLSNTSGQDWTDAAIELDALEGFEDRAKTAIHGMVYGDVFEAAVKNSDILTHDQGQMAAESYEAAKEAIAAQPELDPADPSLMPTNG